VLTIEMASGEARIPQEVGSQLLGVLFSFVRARPHDIMPVRAGAQSLDIGRHPRVAIILPLRGGNSYPKVSHHLSTPEHNMLCFSGVFILRNLIKFYSRSGPINTELHSASTQIDD
jgi:hypothetical protein